MPRKRIWANERERWRARYATNPLRQRQHNAKHKYGVSVEDIEALAAKQDYKCAICRTPFEDPWKQHIDHNHETGRVRGLLCASCNRRLGTIEDTDWVLKALDYLAETD